MNQIKGFSPEEMFWIVKRQCLNFHKFFWLSHWPIMIHDFFLQIETIYQHHEYQFVFRFVFLTVWCVIFWILLNATCIFNLLTLCVLGWSGLSVCWIDHFLALKNWKSTTRTFLFFVKKIVIFFLFA